MTVSRRRFQPHVANEFRIKILKRITEDEYNLVNDVHINRVTFESDNLVVFVFLSWDVNTKIWPYKYKNPENFLNDLLLFFLRRGELWRRKRFVVHRYFGQYFKLRACSLLSTILIETDLQTFTAFYKSVFEYYNLLITSRQ